MELGVVIMKSNLYLWSYWQLTIEEEEPVFFKSVTSGRLAMTQ